jgi:hypothetical protein
VSWGDPDAIGDESAVPCWDTTNYDCPDCSDEVFIQCIGQYGVKDLLITLNIACEDGCCTVSVEIAYTVYQFCDNEIDLMTLEELAPETRYTHTFSGSGFCSCEEVAGAMLSFASTTSTNNGRGITVPDVCNAASATVSLTSDENCGCMCFDCLDFSNDINVALAGGEFTGTVVVEHQLQDIGGIQENETCLFTGSAIGATCGFTVEVEVKCLPCEKYDITVRLRTGDGIDECIATYEKLGTTCDALSGFTFVSQTGTCPCDLDDFTISLS